MGIQINPLRLMIQARQRGTSFREVLTIGRLNVLVSNERLESVLQAAQLKSRSSPPLYASSDQHRYADALFQMLGAETVRAIDYSTYEGATLLHDMNRPIPEAYEERFDVVVEGGTIEHVFNFPVALQNCMRMVRVGGTLFLSQMANNFCGHGFYNFSPELFYRVFDPRYGYEVREMLVYEYHRPDRVYRVADPAIVGERVQIRCTHGTILLMQAQRVGQGKDLLSEPPQQSDYLQAWEDRRATLDAKQTGNGGSNPLRQWLRQVHWLSIPYRAWRDAHRLRVLRRRAHFGDPKWFKPYQFDPLF